MKVDLLLHNQEAYEKIKTEIEEGKKKLAIAHATGTGKSYLIAKLFEDYSEKRKLVLVPSTYISDQIKELFEKYGIQNTDVMLYQKLIKMSDEDIAAMNYDVIALDEYHHDTSKVWGEKVRILIDTHSESIVFGTSATPVRTDGINTIDTLFEGNCASDLPLSESIAKKIVPLPKYVGALYALDDELEKLQKKVDQATNTKEEKQELYKKIDTMRSQIEKSYGMPIILNKNIKDREGKYLIFCKNKKHLAEIKDTVIGWFKTAGFKDIHAYVVHSDYENKDDEYKAFCDDTSHFLKLMFCVDMLNEGLHLENISGVLLLRPTRSSIVWHQQIGRAIEANNTSTPVIIDAVNNFSSVGQGMELLREIKDVIAKEKESDPNFDDSGLEDIDTFFVLEQVIEIQDMFREIEERLEGNWDLYIRALTQYKEREGDCDVPQRHVEIVDGVKISLGSWVGKIRRAKNGNGEVLLTNGRMKQLEGICFIWDSHRFRFENNIKAVSVYYKKNKKYPFNSSKDLEIKKLGAFLNYETMKMRDDNFVYPKWKKELLEKYLPSFSCETQSNNFFDEFIYYAKLYKERYGHINIKARDIIEDYKIGNNFLNWKKKYINNELSEDRARKFEELCFDLQNYKDKNFRNKMQLARQAIKEGVIIKRINSKYKDKNLYKWIMEIVKQKYKNGDLSLNEIHVIEKLVGKSLDDLYRGKKIIKVKVIDVIENREIGIFKSKAQTSKIMQEKYGIKASNPAIEVRLTGKITTPYKGRFMFYYADEKTTN